MKKYIFIDILSHKIGAYIEDQRKDLLEQLSVQFGTEIEYKYMGVIAIPHEKRGGLVIILSFRK